MSFEIVKAGWLYRQSSVLKRWKKNWFVLYKDNILKYFESPDSHVAEDVLRMQTDCISIKYDSEVGVTPPEGHGKNSLIKILGRNDKDWILCGESADDMSAWKYSLEQARILNGVSNQPYPATGPPAYVPQQHLASAYPQQHAVYGYQGQTFYGSHPPPYVVQAPPGQTTVIYQDNPRYRPGYTGGDVAMGMVAGAAIGSMMWGPLLWW